MSRRNPTKKADAALMAQVKEAQARFQAMCAEVETNLARSKAIFDREEKLIDLATKLAETGPNLILPDGPSLWFTAEAILEIQKLTYRSAMTGILHALVKGDFSGLEREFEPRVIQFSAPDFDAFDDTAIAEA